MKQKFIGLIITIILSTIGSLLAIYIQNDFLKTIGYLLIFAAAITLIIELYKNYPSLFYITWRYACTVIVFDSDKVLLVWHPYHKVWLPPGQRIAFQQFPHQSALEVVLKETGYEVEFDYDFHYQEKTIDRDTIQIPQPYFVMREDQGQRGGIKSHYDFYYICKLRGHSPQAKNVLDHKWFRIQELDDLFGKGHLYQDILFILNKAFNDRPKMTNRLIT